MPLVSERSTGPIRVEGLRELDRAFARAGRDMRRNLRDTLKDAARPVAVEAERRVLDEVENIGKGRRRWERMRVGATRDLVYVAPQQRGTNTKRNRDRWARPNLLDEMLPEMEGALDNNITDVLASVDNLIEDVANRWEHF